MVCKDVSGLLIPYTRLLHNEMVETNWSKECKNFFGKKSISALCGLVFNHQAVTGKFDATLLDFNSIFFMEHYVIMSKEGKRASDGLRSSLWGGG